jgi:putative ubiquitin-RnfH superfamily antitoxin RatB of RatAB toxin-antitoxin module
MASEAQLHVSVVYSPAARQVHEVDLLLESGSTARQALLMSGFVQRFPELNQSSLTIGVWGQKADFQQVLCEGDRLEIYRALVVDPKVARRQRFAKQGSRGTGLFLKRRSGAKPGY